MAGNFVLESRHPLGLSLTGERLEERFALQRPIPTVVLMTQAPVHPHSSSTGEIL
jgi:hypothetical protein